MVLIREGNKRKEKLCISFRPLAGIMVLLGLTMERTEKPDSFRPLAGIMVLIYHEIL